MNPDGVILLVTSIYRQAMKDLNMLFTSAARGVRPLNVHEVDKLEAFFRKDPYGIVKDPEAVIEFCEKGRKCYFYDRWV